MVLIEEAQNDLERQCTYAFKEYSYSLSLMAIASAGDHWSYAHVPSYMVTSVEDVYGAPRAGQGLKRVGVGVGAYHQGFGW